jgi:hypothetical protein
MQGSVRSLPKTETLEPEPGPSLETGLGWNMMHAT